MAGRSTRSNTANNTNPLSEIADEVARQLNIALPNLLTQLVQVLGGNRQIKERLPKAAVSRHSGLLVPRNSLTQKSAVSMANHLTTDGIKDGIFKKRENARNKKRLNDQNKNRGRDDRNKRQRTGRNFALTTPEQEQGQRQYARPHPKCAKCNFHHSGGNRPNPLLAIEGNPNLGNNQNRAQGRAFGLGVAEAPHDPNIVMGTFSLNDHFAIVLFDYGADYSFIPTNFLPLINIKPSVISPGYEIEIASGLK
ncbi:hypothetical protein Tco_1281589, partial [Tanacetum coccineum]